MRLDRRDFLRSSAGLGALATLPAAALRAAEKAPASERIRLGFIGVKNQGSGNIKAFAKQANAQIVAVCDVDKKVLAAAKDLADKSTQSQVDAVADYRRLLDRKDIDAVVITTPDHWHALMTVNACLAGKDVYCEKPLTLTVADGQAMVKAARRTDRIVQTGSQQRSADEFRRAAELVRNGKLGKLKGVKVGISGVNYKDKAIAGAKDGPPPAELDYDAWLGPAPMRPYNVNRVHYNFRFFWDYSGGQLTNWGAHHLDITQWALGMDESGPVSIEGTAQFVKTGEYEVPERQRIVYKYADGLTVLCGQEFKGGATFEGEKGTLHVTRGKIASTPDGLLKSELAPSDTRLYASKNHHANWLECVKSRKLPICDVAIGHRSATVCHLGNIASRLGRAIKWDPQTETIVGDSEAAAMLGRPYRKPWEMPSV